MQKDRIRTLSFHWAYERIALPEDYPLFILYYNVFKDQITALHCHDALEIGICLKGHGIFVLDQQIHTYKEGDVFVIGTNVYHRANSASVEDGSWAFLYYKPEQWALPPLPTDLKLVKDRMAHPALSRLTELLAKEAANGQENYKQVCKGLLLAVHSYIIRILQQEKQLPHGKRPGDIAGLDSRIKHAVDMMINASLMDMSIKALAAECCLSESHFRQLFKNQLGTTPKQFQTQLKLKMAMNLLRGSALRVVDISYECGFQSLCSFNRQFKAETGLSPLQWRQQAER